MNKLIIKQTSIYFFNTIRLLLIYNLLCHSPLFCNPTNLDSSFNPNGSIPGTLEIPAIDNSIPPVATSYSAQTSFAAIIQPSDQKIITSGWGSINIPEYSIFLARYLENGDLDTVANGGSGFGSGSPAPGYANVQLHPNADSHGLMSTKAYAMILQPDGKIVVAAQNNYNLALIRFTSSGIVDTTFNAQGTNPGYIISSIPTNTSNITSISMDIQSTGNIVVSSSVTLIDETKQVAIYRYTTNGELDTTFPNGSGPGYFTTYINPSSTSTTPYNIAIMADDEIVIGCQEIINNIAQILVARYTANGQLDTSFNNTGYASFSESSNIISNKGAITTQSNGDIILTVTTTNSSSINEILTIEYTSNGTLNTSFGLSQNYATISIPNSFDLTAQGITLEPSGKVIVTGFVNLNTLSEPIYSLIIIRYNNDGSLDTTFHPLGYITTAIGNSSGDTTFAYSTPVQKDGKLLVAGQNNNHLFLARYVGGTIPQDITSTIDSYGRTSNFVSDFLYSDFYATTITNPIVKAATISAIKSTISTYNANYANQTNFNYITYLYLLKAEFTTIQATLKSDYPNSSKEIDLCFNYINKRILKLITSA